MQKIKYHVDSDKKANTWFAKVPRSTQQVLRSELEKLLNEICEHAVLNDTVWQTATEIDGKFWGKGRYFGSWTGSNMISVLAGAIKKLREGDLTAKQVDHVNRIFEVVKEFNRNGLLRVEIQEFELEAIDSEEQTPMERLRGQLFYD